jgi:hypothetical protein
MKLHGVAELHFTLFGYDMVSRDFVPVYFVF